MPKENETKRRNVFREAAFLADLYLAISSDDKTVVDGVETAVVMQLLELVFSVSSWRPIPLGLVAGICDTAGLTLGDYFDVVGE